MLAETAGGTNPYFGTGAGGTLQTLVYGFGGLSLDAPGLLGHGAPALPAGWRSVRVLRASDAPGK